MSEENKHSKASHFELEELVRREINFQTYQEREHNLVMSYGAGYLKLADTAYDAIIQRESSGIRLAKMELKVSGNSGNDNNQEIIEKRERRFKAMLEGSGNDYADIIRETIIEIKQIIEGQQRGLENTPLSDYLNLHVAYEELLKHTTL